MNNQALFRALYYVLLAATPPAFSASSIDPSPEDIYISDAIPIVVSPSRMPQSIADAPGAVTVINRDFIRKTGYRDIARLFRLIPGFQVVRDYEHTSVVSYHGSHSYFPNRMQVLIDGRSVYSPYIFGGADWGGLPITIDEIERIEILRGSNSATYGSNAFLGVVNIVTRHTAHDPGMAFQVSRGDHGVSDQSISLGKRFGDLGLRFNGSFTADDYDISDPSTKNRQNIFTLRADYRIDPMRELTFWVGENNGRRGHGYPGTPFNYNGVRTVDSRNSFIHARWRYTPSAGEELSIGYYRNKERGIEEWFMTPRSNLPQSIFPTIPEPKNREAFLNTLCGSLSFIPNPNLFLVSVCNLPSAIPADYNRVGVRDNIDFQHYFSPVQNVRIAWGGEARRDWFGSERMFHDTKAKSTVLGRIFANAEWNPSNALTLNGGASIEKYQAHATNVAPRFFANWHVAPGQTLRAGMSRAYRQPSLAEESGNLEFYAPDGTLLAIGVTSTGRLRPEAITALELGYTGSSKLLDSSLDLRLFREKISDYIVTVEGPIPNAPLNLVLKSPPFFTINSPETTAINGLEYQIKSHPWRDAEMIFSHTLIRTTGAQNLPGAAYDISRIAPRQAGSLTLLQKFSDAWSGSLSFMRIGSYRPAESSAIGARTIVDAHLAYRTGPVQVSLNLIDGGSRNKEFQAEGHALTMPQSIPNRHVYLTLRLEY